MERAMDEISTGTLISAAKSLDIQLVEMIEFFKVKNGKRGAALKYYELLTDTKLHAVFEQYRLAAYELRVMYEQRCELDQSLAPYESFCEVLVLLDQAELDALRKNAAH